MEIDKSIVIRVFDQLKNIYRVKTYEELMEIITRPSFEFPLTFTKTVPPGTMFERDDEGMNYEVTFSGYIDGIDITIPPGSRNLVGVRVGLSSGSKDIQLFPYRAEWFNVEVVEKRIPVYYPFKKGDKIWVEFINWDAAYEHTPVVRVNISTKVFIQGIDILGGLGEGVLHRVR